MSPDFDFENVSSELRSGKGLTGKEGVLMPLIKQEENWWDLIYGYALVLLIPPPP